MKTENIKRVIDTMENFLKVNLDEIPDTIKNAKKELENITNELDGWENAKKFVMCEECSSSEKHCGCVAILRHELNSKNVEIEKLKNAKGYIIYGREDNLTFINVPTLKEQLDYAKDMFEKIVYGETLDPVATASAWLRRNTISTNGETAANSEK